MNVYDVSDELKQSFKDEEGEFPSVEISLGDHGLVHWRFYTYSLDSKDLEILTALAKKYGLEVKVLRDLKLESSLRVILSAKVPMISCAGQKIGLVDKRSK